MSYPEPLSKALPKLPPDLGDSEAVEWAEAFQERLHLLFSYYKISRDDKDKWVTLAWKLMLHHVPAFRNIESRKSLLGAPGRKRERERGSLQRQQERKHLLALIDANKSKTLKTDNAVWLFLKSQKKSALPARYRECSASLFKADLRTARAEGRNKLLLLAELLMEGSSDQPSLTGLKVGALKVAERPGATARPRGLLD
jgi:hypothetical protein